jgi:hypothetical protein
MAEDRGRNRRLAVLLLAVLALNFPPLGLADLLVLPGGTPLTPFYLFGAWAALIVLAALSAGPSGRR